MDCCFDMVMVMVIFMGMGFNCCFMCLFSLFGSRYVFLRILSLQRRFLFCMLLLALLFVSVIKLLNDHIAAKVTNHGGKYIDQQIGNHDPMVDAFILVPFLGGGGVFDLNCGPSKRLYLGEE